MQVKSLQAELAAEEIIKAGGGDQGQYDTISSIDFREVVQLIFSWLTVIDFFIVSRFGWSANSIACNYWIKAFQGSSLECNKFFLMLDVC